MTLAERLHPIMNRVVPKRRNQKLRDMVITALIEDIRVAVSVHLAEHIRLHPPVAELLQGPTPKKPLTPR